MEHNHWWKLKKKGFCTFTNLGASKYNPISGDMQNTLCKVVKGVNTCYIFIL